MKTENVLHEASARNDSVLTVAGKEKEHHGRIRNLLPGQYTVRGSTAHFIVYYFTDSTTMSQSMADAVLGACERDYSNLFSCFGLTPTGVPFQIYIDPGSSGGSHRFCYTTSIHLDDFGAIAGDIVNLANVAEFSEVFMANQGIGWNCKFSNGEGLSRVLGGESYPDAIYTFSSGAMWLDSNDRPDWVTITNLPMGTLSQLVAQHFF